MLKLMVGPCPVPASMTGTHCGPWPGAGRAVELLVIIHFPWDPAAQKFAGERVYFDRAALAAGGLAPG